MAAQLGIQQHLARRVADLVISEIGNCLASGNHAEFRGFGSFKVKVYQARIGRNPSNGAPIHVKAKGRVAFKAGGVLRDRIDGKRKADEHVKETQS